MRFLIYLKEEIRKRLTAGKFPAYLSFTLMKESVNPQKLWVLTIQNLVRDTRVQKQLLKSKEMVRTYAFLPFLSFPSPIRSRASYGGNPVFGRFLTPWIPVPRLREDKLHGNDTDCVSPNYVFVVPGFSKFACMVCIRGHGRQEIGHSLFLLSKVK